MERNIKNQKVEDLLKTLNEIRDIIMENSSVENKTLKSTIKSCLFKVSSKPYVQRNLDKQNHINSIIFELFSTLYRELIIIQRQQMTGLKMELQDNFFDKDYFQGGIKSPYIDYELCKKDVERLGSVILKYFYPRKFLEVGCAYGFLPKFLRKKGIRAFGIDISEFAVKKGNEKYIKVGDIRNLKDFTSQEFDMVLCSEVLEHISEKDIEKSIRELWRVSSKFLILTINLDENDKYLDLSHISIFPLAYWEEKFRKLSLKRDKDMENKIRKDKNIRFLEHDEEIFIFNKK